jgi:hypothetical protein
MVMETTTAEHPDIPAAQDAPAGHHWWHDKLALWRGRWDAWRAWLASPRAYPLYVFAVSRILLLSMTYAGVALLTVGHGQHRLAGVHAGQMMLAWDHWDAKWYTGIAADGYAGYKPGPSSAFFPLLPALMHVFGAPFAAGVGPPAYFIGGMILSNVAFLGALVLVQALAAHLTGDELVAQRAILYLAVFPKAFFAFTAYTEAIFLLLIVASYFLMRRGHFGWAGLLAGLATLTRFFGVLLVVPFAIELYRQCGRDWRAWLRGSWSLLNIPVALAGYMLVLRITIGDPLGFWHAEDHWARHFLEPLQSLWIAVVTLPQLPFGSTLNLDRVFDLIVTAIALGVLIYALTPRGRASLGLPVSLVVFGLALIVVPLSDPLTGNLPYFIASTSRFVLVAFPVFIVLGRLLASRPRWHEAYLLLAVSLLVVFALGFILYGYVV